MVKSQQAQDFTETAEMAARLWQHMADDLPPKAKRKERRALAKQAKKMAKKLRKSERRSDVPDQRLPGL